MGVGSSYPATLALFFVISMAGRALSRMVWTMSNNWRCPSTYFEIIGHSSMCPWHVFFRFVCRSTESGLSESDSGLTNGSNEDATERERALREKVRIIPFISVTIHQHRFLRSFYCIKAYVATFQITWLINHQLLNWRYITLQTRFLWLCMWHYNFLL